MDDFLESANSDQDGDSSSIESIFERISVSELCETFASSIAKEDDQMQDEESLISIGMFGLSIEDGSKRVSKSRSDEIGVLKNQSNNYSEANEFAPTIDYGQRTRVFPRRGRRRFPMGFEIDDDGCNCDFHREERDEKQKKEVMEQLEFEALDERAKYRWLMDRGLIKSYDAMYM
ncbi:hypothetical protein ACOME3_003126 [Neoechinorhynchus agilis]